MKTPAFIVRPGSKLCLQKNIFPHGNGIWRVLPSDFGIACFRLVRLVLESFPDSNAYDACLLAQLSILPLCATFSFKRSSNLRNVDILVIYFRYFLM